MRPFRLPLPDARPPRAAVGQDCSNTAFSSRPVEIPWIRLAVLACLSSIFVACSERSPRPSIVSTSAGPTSAAADRSPSPPTVNKKQQATSSDSQKQPSKGTTAGWLSVTASDTCVVAAMEFLKDISAGAPRPEHLSEEFVRTIGRPWELPGDREKGYSRLAAESWLKRAGAGRTFTPPLGRTNAQWCLLSGTADGPRGSAHYYLRLHTAEGKQWRVDFFVLSSAQIQGQLPDKQDEWSAGFTLQSWLAAVADREALVPEDRALLIAAVLAPDLRKAWAAPFDSDLAQGYDFNRGQLLLKADAFAREQRQFHLRPLDPPRHWQVEGMGNKKDSRRWVLTLEPADTAGRWQITRVQETP